MIPVLEYAKSPRGYEAQMACAMARIECKINVYDDEPGVIDGSLKLWIDGKSIVIGSHELDKSVEDAMETQRQMINRWFSQKWTAQ
jgi:hypothetical protein